MIKVVSVNTSKKTGTIKLPVPGIKLTENGVEGDAHAGPWNRQVSLLGTESIRKFEKDAGRTIAPGEFAENITTSGMELWKCKPLDRFVNNEVVLEITQIGKECHGTSCSIFREVGNCVMPKEGIFCRVLMPGTLKPGATLTYLPKKYIIQVITLSDRASAGHYEDKSGPRLMELINSFFDSYHALLTTHHELIPDSSDQFKFLLKKARANQPDIRFTTGGTGIGPKDITPDVVRPFLDKEIPGIMDAIRMKYGMEKPQALLSRSIAGVMGKTLVFCLPGSIRAVNEYFAEISRSLFHMIYMIHNLDSH
jgi:molybdenum cofactor synthesis domain-containing protein